MTTNSRLYTEPTQGYLDDPIVIPEKIMELLRKMATVGNNNACRDCVIPENDEQTEVKPEPPYRVVLYNDNENEYNHVVNTLHRLLPCSLDRAFLLTEKAHSTGRAICKIEGKSAALKHEAALRQEGLDVVAEPMDE